MTDVTEERISTLIGSCSEALGGRHLIVVSNRGPVEHRVGTSGELQTRRGSGGLVTAFLPLLGKLRLTWISSAMGEGDRVASRQANGASITSRFSRDVAVRYVCPPRRVYHKFYNIFCNPMLWFLQHYMWSSAYTPSVDGAVHDAWEHGYTGVNSAFSEEVLSEAAVRGGGVCVMLHDYHLYLVAGRVRRMLPEALIHHFIHIPWPSARYWELLPLYMRRSICASLCNADIVAFQTWHDGFNFLHTCDSFLPGATVDYNARTVCLNGSPTYVKAYPQSINVEEVRRIAASPRVRDYESVLQTLPGEQTIVRVDRAEPNKNILRGFRAYELLLQRYPEMRGHVKFLAFLVPSRTHIRQYQRYVEEVEQISRNINARYGSPEWAPVHLFMENNYLQAIAGLRVYDALLVNPVIDGMNLVAKEGPVVNRRKGIMLLSESAGAYPQLSHGALPLAPADIEGTMQAMYQALTMSQEERQHREAALIEAIQTQDVFHWFQRQFDDIRLLAS